MPIPIAEGAYLIKVPSLFPVGATNSYLINAGKLSLIDVGLKTKKSYETLVKELASANLKVEDIEKIVVTHAHVDHFGLIRKLQEESSCDVHVHTEDFFYIADYEFAYLKRMDYFREILSGSGTPQKVLDDLQSAYQFLKDIGDSPLNCRKINDGEIVKLGSVELETFHTPGHTIGEISLLWREMGILFCGDHLLKDITPNVGVTLGEGPHLSLLPDYLKSLEKTLKLPGEIALPGHRDPIEDFRGRALQIMRHHEERKKLMLEITRKGEKSAFEISNVVFGKVALSEIPLAIAETMSHLGVLEDEGKTSSKMRNGVIFYSASS